MTAPRLFLQRSIDGSEGLTRSWTLSFSEVDQYEDETSMKIRKFMQKNEIRKLTITKTEGSIAQKLILAFGCVFFNIERIHLESLKNIPDQNTTFCSIFRKARSLQEIQLIDMKLSAHVIEEWARIEIPRPPLKKLICLEVVFEGGESSEQHFANVLQRQTALEELGIEPSQLGMSLKFLGPKIKLLNNLTSLSLSNIEVEALVGEDQSCYLSFTQVQERTMEHLSMIECGLTHESLQTIFTDRRFERLRSLDLSRNPGIEERDIDNLKRMYPFLVAGSDTSHIDSPSESNSLDGDSDSNRSLDTQPIWDSTQQY